MAAPNGTPSFAVSYSTATQTRHCGDLKRLVSKAGGESLIAFPTFPNFVGTSIDCCIHPDKH